MTRAILQVMAERPWDGDERGGVAAAGEFVEGLRIYRPRCSSPTGSPSSRRFTFFLISSRRAERSPLQILYARTADDGSYEMRLPWTQEQAGIGATRASVFSLLGGIAEPASYIRQLRTDSPPEAPPMLTFEVVTGIVDDVPFQPPGHTLRVGVVTK